MNTWIFVSGVLGVFRDPCHSPDDPTQVDQTVSAVTQELTHMTGIPASSPTAVEVGGKSGTAFTLDVQIDTSTSSCTHGDMLPEWRLPLGWNFNGVSGSHQKVWVLDVGAAPLLVTVISFEAAPPIDAQSAEDIVNSMTFP